ncbi:MAG: MmgE/PrpD family protein [Kofleriaceae bacterium]|nr:MmgE/PrpD family protein [Kofleriaceae bacterium]
MTGPAEMSARGGGGGGDGGGAGGGGDVVTGGGALAPLGAWVAATRWADLPEAARRAARYQILDMVAAAHATARAPELARLLDGLPHGAGPSTVVATGARLAPADAAFVNAAFSMAQDYDDIIWMGHTCHSAVFAALAVAEAEGKDGRDLVTAVVVANEIAGRLGASSFLGPLNGQMWTFIHLVGAAAATASLLGLDATRSAHALAIALAQPPFALQPAFFGPTSKLLAASVPTQIGIQAAYLARAGMTGALDVLEDRRGFWQRFTFQPLPEMLGDLGTLWAITSLTIKTAPVCHYFQTACEAAESLVRTERPALDQVRRVVVATSKLGDEVNRFAREYAGADAPDLSPVGVSFDLGLTVAVVMHAGRFTGEEAETAWLEANADALRAWYAKIVVEHDPALTARVLGSARSIPTGKQALRSLRPADWLRLVRRYREQYGSSLLRAREAVNWVRLALRGRQNAPRPGRGDGIPLYFPNRVTIELLDGTVEAQRVDLPAGSMAQATMEPALQAKFLREVGARLGAEAAAAGHAAGLALEDVGVAGFVAAIAGRR